MERSARVGEILLPSPPAALSYFLMALLALATTAMLGADLAAGRVAFVLVLAPAALAGALGPATAWFPGRPFYHRRSAGLAALGAGIATLTVLAWVALEPLGIPPAKTLFLGYGFVWVIRFAVVSVVVDSRTTVSAALSSIQPLVALPGIMLVTGTGSLGLGIAT